MNSSATGDRDAFAHEVLDRTMITGDLWDRHIVAHRFVKNDPDLKLVADRIADLLGEFYQLAGQRMRD